MSTPESQKPLEEQRWNVVAAMVGRPALEHVAGVGTIRNSDGIDEINLGSLGLPNTPYGTEERVNVVDSYARAVKLRPFDAGEQPDNLELGRHVANSVIGEAVTRAGIAVPSLAQVIKINRRAGLHRPSIRGKAEGIADSFAFSVLGASPAARLGAARERIHQETARLLGEEEERIKYLLKTKKHR